MIKSFLTYLQCELNSSAHTVLSYSHDLRELGRYQHPGAENPLEALEPAELTSVQLRLWVAQMAKQGLSFRTIRRRLAAVSTLFRYLQRQGLAEANPVKLVPLARVPKRLPTTVRSDELNALLDIPDEQFPVTAPRQPEQEEFTRVRNHLMLLMLYTTGMRRAELIDVRDADVDTRNGQLRVVGKRRKERIIPFGPELSEAIERYRSMRPITTSPQLLVLPNGRPLYPMAVERAVRTALLATGTHAQKLSPHTLRHSCATDLLRDGAQLTAVRDMLGHSSLRTTQIYTHLTYSDLQHNYQLAHPRAQKN